MNSDSFKSQSELVLLWLAASYMALVLTAGAAPKPALVGRLVDVEDKPIAGAKLVFEASEMRWLVPIPEGPTYTSRDKVSAKTDAFGVFRLPFSKEHLRLMSMENTGHWLEPNQGLASSWRGEWSPAPGSTPGGRQVLHGKETDIGNVLAYPFPSPAELAQVKETPAISTTIHDEQTVEYRWTAGAFDLPGGDGPRLSISLRLFQEPGFPAQVRLTFRGIQAELWAGDNELPYAPAEHYERGLMLFAPPATARPVSFFLYLRSHDPVRFARVAVSYDWRKHQLTCAARHNPTGSRLMASPGYLPAPRQVSLGNVRNVRAEWWAGLEHLMPGQTRPAEYFVLFDAGRAEAAFQRHAATIQPRQSVSYLTRSALEHLARNPTTQPSVLEAMLREQLPLVGTRLTSNPSMPTNLLHAIMSTNQHSLYNTADKNLKQAEARRRFLRGD